MKKVIVCFVMAAIVSAGVAACSKPDTSGGNSTEKAVVAETQGETETKAGATEQGGERDLLLPPEGYPEKNIEFVVPAAAGATLDLLTRGLNDSGLDLGKPLAITNMAGASQTLGLAEVASRKADGYTLTCSGAAGTLVQPLLLDLSYSMEDFRYISMLNAPVPNSVAVAADSQYQTWDDIAEALKAGETLHYTSANTGSVGHMAALELMSQMNAESAVYVSYNGAAEATAALLSGDVEFFINDVDLVMERVKEGQFRCLLTLDKERSPFAPEVPAAAEYGMVGLESFMGMTWIMIDAETPDDIVAYVKQQLDLAVGSEAFAGFLKSLNKEPTPVVSEQELTDMLYQAREAYRQVVEKMNQ